MTDPKDSPPDFSDLRRRAEERLQAEAIPAAELSPAEAARLIHELRVHQIELEMQNEDLRLSQAMLEESRSKYADLYDFAPVGYLTLDERGQILEANLTAASLLGMERHRLLGQFFPHFLGEADRPPFRQLLNNILNQAEQRGEFCLRDDRGVGRAMLLDLHFTKNAEGREQRRLALTEITDLKRVQEELRLHKEELGELVAERTAELVEVNDELREANDNLRALFEAAPLAIGVFDAQGKILNINPASQRIFGWSLEELEGRLLPSIPPGAPEPSLVVLQRVLQGEAFVGAEIRQQRQDGSLIDVSCSAAPLYDGGGKLRGFIGLAEDITERKKLEEAAHTQARVLENMAEAVTVTDRHGNILYTNPAFDAMFGYEPGELLGRHSHILNYYPPEESLTMVRDILRQVDAGGVWTGEFHNCKKDGSPFFTAATISALTLGGKKLYISVQEDITARKGAEAEIRRMASFPELNPNPVLEADETGRVIYANPVARKVAAAQALPGGVRAFLPADLKEKFALARQGGPRHYSFDLPLKGAVYAVVLSFTLDLPTARLYALDITERQRAEDALRESREDLNRAQAVAHTGSWRLDVQKNELTWSDENHRIFGIAPGTPMTYETFLRTIHPEDREYVDRMWQAALRGEPYDIEHRIVVDGAVKWVRERAELEFNCQGRLLGGFGTTQDITGRKEMEEALKEAYAHTAAILDSISDSFLSLDRDMVVTYYNRAAEQVLGRKAEDVLGRMLFDAFPEARGSIFEEQFTTALRTGKATAFEAHFVVPPLENWYDVRVYPFGQDLSIYFQVTTERKRAEHELARQKQLLQGIIDNIPVMLTIYDPHLKAFRFNQAFRQVLGWTEDDAQVDDPMELFYPDPRYRERARAYMDSLEPGWRDFQVTTKEGGIVDSAWANIRLCDETQIGIGVDIRERKQAEVALKRQHTIVDRINRVFQEALTCETQEQLGETCLTVAEELTDSKLGFIVELNPEGSLDVIAISYLGWAACKIPDTQKLVKPISFPVHGIYATCLGKNRCDLANDPATHPDRIGVPEGHPPINAFLGAPLKHGGKTIGMIGLGNKEGGYTNADREAMEAIAVAIAEALMHKKAELAVRQAREDLEKRVAERTAELRQTVEQLQWEITERRQSEEALRESEERLRFLASQLLTVQETERKRLALELHDDLGQSLMVLKLKLRALERNLPRELSVAREGLSRSLEYINEVIDNVRRMSRNLRPSILEDLGLDAALKHLLDEFSRFYEIRVRLDMEDIKGMVSSEAQITIYRIFQESLTNIAKHAQATEIKVTIEPQEGQVAFQVEDNGAGFEPQEVLSKDFAKRGMGLTAMDERVWLLGGKLEISSQPGTGTRISFTVPMESKP